MSVHNPDPDTICEVDIQKVSPSEPDKLIGNIDDGGEDEFAGDVVAHVRLHQTNMPSVEGILTLTLVGGEYDGWDWDGSEISSDQAQIMMDCVANEVL